MGKEYEISVRDNKVNPNELNSLQEKKVSLTLHRARLIAKEYLAESSEVATELYAYSKLSEFIDQLVDQDELWGDADDFHNFAVELAISKQENLACKIIEYGIKQYPKNVDLLADYLEYGKLSRKEKECDHYYQILMGIPRRKWTWRGFSFSIGYLLHKIEDVSDNNEFINELQSMIEGISDDYVKFFPYNEDGYRVRAKVFSRIKDDPDKEVEILRECLEKINVCPKTALRCAEINFERGEYNKALVAIERAIDDANQTQGSINEGYVYYLSGLCKIAIMRKSEEIILEKTVVDIYTDFNCAFLEFGSDINTSYREVMVKKSKTLNSKYGIEIPYECTKLLENMDE